MTQLRCATAVSALLFLSACVVTVPAGLRPSASAPLGSNSSDPASKAPTTDKAVKAVRLLPESAVLTVGHAKNFDAAVAYTDGTFDSSVVWSSSDDTVLTINPITGLMQANRPGIATVLVTSTSDASKRGLATVTVRDAGASAALTRITPSAASLTIGETVQLRADVQMTNSAISPNVIWSSANQGVAMVSNGLVTAVGNGTTTVTATAADDSTKRAVATITVGPASAASPVPAPAASSDPT